MSTSDTRRRAAGIALAFLVVVGLILLALQLRSAPQIGADPEVFKTVDALFTAVTSKNTKQLSECEQRLHALKDSGKLPRSASDYLDALIAKARAGSWRGAAEELYGFMQAQRRQSA